MKGLLALLVAAMMVVGSAHAQDAAATAVDPNGWAKEIATANKLLAAGYTDAAQKDFESVIQRYAANSAGIDRAWLGLSKIHMAKYDYDQAKVSLEEVLRRNSDPEAIAGAKTTYRQLKQEADGQAQQAQKALQFLEMQYAQTSWLNPFAKLFTYLDLKKARTAAEAALAASNGYDPHYFIDDVAASAINTNVTLTGTEFQPVGLDTPANGAAASGTATNAIAATGAAAGVSVHTPAPAASGTAASVTSTPTVALTGSTAGARTTTATAAASIVVTPSPAPAASVTPTPAPSPIVISTSGTTASTAAASATAAPAASATAAAEPDLITLQRGYQESYRKLQEAITMGNQSRIVALNAEYQKALEAYRKAAASGRR